MEPQHHPPHPPSHSGDVPHYHGTNYNYTSLFRVSQTELDQSGFANGRCHQKKKKTLNSSILHSVKHQRRGVPSPFWGCAILCTQVTRFAQPVSLSRRPVTVSSLHSRPREPADNKKPHTPRPPFRNPAIRFCQPQLASQMVTAYSDGASQMVPHRVTQMVSQMVVGR